MPQPHPRPLAAPAHTVVSPPLPQLLVDVSQLVKIDFAAGIQRVVKSVLLQWLGSAPPHGYRLRLVAANQLEKGYFYCDALVPHLLAPHARSRGNMPPANQIIETSPGDIFLGLDLDQHTVVAQDTHGTYDELRGRGVRVVFVAYDILPISHKHRFWPAMTAAHTAWLRVLSRNDGVLCISKTVAQEIKDLYALWMDRGQIDFPRAALRWFHLGVDAPNTARRPLGQAENELLAGLAQGVNFLMVSTIEPRKGHLQTLAAFDLLWQQGHTARLVIVGKLGWGVPGFANKVRQHRLFGQQLFWLEGIDDALLHAVYARCHCLIAASEGEGFGLPLLEAAGHGLALFARDIPVFREVAGEHAFYFQARFANEMAQALDQWLRLAQAGRAPGSQGLRGLTWQESAMQLWGLIQELVLHPAQQTHPPLAQALLPSPLPPRRTLPEHALGVLGELQQCSEALHHEQWERVAHHLAQIQPYCPVLPDRELSVYHAMQGLLALGQVPTLGPESAQAAIVCLRQAIGLDPANAWFYHHTGRAYHSLGQLDLAAAAYHHALELDNEIMPAHVELGKFHHRRGDYTPAWQHYSRAANAGWMNTRADYTLLAQTAGYAGDWYWSDYFYEKLSVDEDGQADYYQRWIWGFQKFAMGEFEQAWAFYDERHRVPHVAQSYPFAWPRWPGPLAPSHAPAVGAPPAAPGPLLVHGEQGLGDEIMFAASLPRLLQDCTAMGQPVVLAVKPPLLRLFAHNFPNCRVVPHHHTAGLIAPLQAHDIAQQIPLANLPAFYCRDEAGFAQNRRPYLRASDASVTKFAGLLDLFRPNWQQRLRVGLVWGCAQGKSPELDARAIALAEMAPYFASLDLMFVSLHNNDHSHEALLARSMDVLDLGQWHEDFEDTAGLISLMDVVVGVDTATTHLAGAMGKLVLQPLVRYPDWRRSLPGDACPWYANTHYFRQTLLGQWSDVLERIAQQLGHLRAT